MEPSNGVSLLVYHSNSSTGQSSFAAILGDFEQTGAGFGGFFGRKEWNASGRKHKLMHESWRYGVFKFDIDRIMGKGPGD